VPVVHGYGPGDCLTFYHYNVGDTVTIGIPGRLADAALRKLGRPHGHEAKEDIRPKARSTRGTMIGKEWAFRRANLARTPY